MEQLIEMVHRNIANHLIQIEFHAKASDATLNKYYGGAVVREKMIEQSIHSLEGDIVLLDFITNNKENILTQYGNKKPSRGLVATIRRDVGSALEARGRIGDSQATATGGGTQGRVKGSDNGSGVPEEADSTGSDTSDSAGGRDTTNKARGSKRKTGK